MALAETTGQAPEGDRPKASDKGVKDKGMDNKKDKGAAAKGSSDANGRDDVKAKTNDTAQGATGAKSSQSTTTEKDRATTGQGAAAGSANLSTERAPRSPPSSGRTRFSRRISTCRCGLEPGCRRACVSIRCRRKCSWSIPSGEATATS
jgi:hypothetical protein